MSARPATELLPAPGHGRRFGATRSVRLGDVDPAGELRLDAIARYLQDVASDDALDADLPNALAWVVRRTMVRIDRPAAIGESVDLTTFCTGAGRSWAERRTSIEGAQGASIEAVSLWVQVDPASGRPARLTDEFFAIYGSAAGGRVVSSKLSLPAPPTPTADGSGWRFRATDLDQFDHVNNAAQWAIAEQCVRAGGLPRRGLFELEYLAPVDADVDLELVIEPDRAWLLADGATCSAFAWEVRH